VQELGEANRHAFTTTDLWPPNSHCLNQFTTKSRNIIQQQVYQTKVQDMNDLRCLCVGWSGTGRY